MPPLGCSFLHFFMMPLHLNLSLSPCTCPLPLHLLSLSSFINSSVILLCPVFSSSAQLLVLSRRLFFVLNTPRLWISSWYKFSSLFWIRPVIVASSTNFKTEFPAWLEIRSWVNIANKKGLSTQPWRFPLLTTKSGGGVTANLYCLGSDFKKCNIQRAISFIG